jgi:ribonuclease HI
MSVIIYTDGGALGNPGPGGYGVVMRYGKHCKELSEGFRLTTNNRMELLAVIRALQALKKDGLEVHVYTDSQYVQKAVTQGWVFNWERKGFAGRKNGDLWQQFLPLYRKHKVHFHWVRGHTGIPDNERCDELAKAAAAGTKLPPDRGYEAEIASKGK